MADTAHTITETVETPRDIRLRLTAHRARVVTERAVDAGRGNPQTRDVPAERCREHGEEFAACLRLIVETWANGDEDERKVNHRRTPIPQWLSNVIMRGKEALNHANGRD